MIFLLFFVSIFSSFSEVFWALFAVFFWRGREREKRLIGIVSEGGEISIKEGEREMKKKEKEIANERERARERFDF